jgi:hypothetical protein
MSILEVFNLTTIKILNKNSFFKEIIYIFEKKSEEFTGGHHK